MQRLLVMLVSLAALMAAWGVGRTITLAGSGAAWTGEPPASENKEHGSMRTTGTTASGSGAASGQAGAGGAAVRYSGSGHDITKLSPERIEELARGLTAEERAVILAKGTERPFCGDLLENTKDGTYVCRLCGLPLFSSEGKFDSGTGWPSYFKPVDPQHVITKPDHSHGMKRTEILCARCEGHLGHVFEDGPRPTGRRYCVNSASLSFVEDGTEFPPLSRPVRAEVAYFGGGCFWGLEDRFAKLPGVMDAVSGYQGGRTKNPTYKEVSFEDTGHAEVVRVTFDPARLSYVELLRAFFRFHDPTQLNRQGPDIGEQYRSVIFTESAEQQLAAEAFIARQSERSRFRGARIVTQVLPVSVAGPFWEAEAYHQDYNARTGRQCFIPYYEVED